MCGIVGVYSYASSRSVDPPVLQTMCEKLAHRGPDGQDIWVSGDRSVGLGHRRLAIVDLTENAGQPMANEDSSVWVTYNGEIYNHLRLRKELSAQGHCFRSDHADTEVILHGYEQWGIDGLLERLDGDYAFGLWDNNQESLFIARDPIGVKPLYFTVQQGLIVFSSEIKAIFASPYATPKMDDTALYHYLTFLVTPAPSTLFRGIRKMRPGCYLEVKKGTAPKITRFWDVAESTRACVVREQYSDVGSVASEVLRRFGESVKKRMMADVSIGVFLSGGVDSSASVALMSQYSHSPLNTFTVGFDDDSENNEYLFARQVSDLYSTNHSEVLITQNDARESWEKIVYMQDEPLADWVCIPLYFISRLARSQNVSVVQVGEGSDEQFSGYAGYLQYLKIYNNLWEPYVKYLPKRLRALFSLVVSSISRLTGRGKTYVDLFSRAAKGQELFLGGAVAFLEKNKGVLLGEGYTQTVGDNIYDIDDASYSSLSSPEVVDSLLAGYKVGESSRDYLKRMIYLEFRQRLAELLLMRVDKITMGSSVEARVPYLDKALVEYSMNMPSRYKIHGGCPKYILKKAVKGILPNEIVYRKKVGFSAPVSKWLREEWGRAIEAEILQSRLVKSRLLNGSYIKSLFERHRNRKSDFSVQLWVVYNLTTWYKLWID